MNQKTICDSILKVCFSSQHLQIMYSLCALARLSVRTFNQVLFNFFPRMKPNILAITMFQNIQFVKNSTVIFALRYPTRIIIHSFNQNWNIWANSYVCINIDMHFTLATFGGLPTENDIKLHTDIFMGRRKK